MEKKNRKLNDAARALLGKPIINEAYKMRQIGGILKQTEWFDYTKEDWASSQALLAQRYMKLPEDLSKTEDPDERTIQWLVCNFEHPYGGVFTVFRIANYLQDKGWKNSIIIYDNPDFEIDKHMKAINQYFPSLSRENFKALRAGEGVENLPSAQLAVATFWASAFYLIKMRKVKNKAYLIQDFEPAFYPAGTTYALAECTYRMPFNRLYNTPGLMHFIEDNYRLKLGRAQSFTPGVDAYYEFEQKPLKTPIKILLYARPNTPRNAFELMLAFARALKAKYGDAIEIIGAGERSEHLAELCRGIIDFVGVIDYDQLPQFYAQFHILISFMMTKHPSYLPFEAMACGCAVIANLNEANAWFLKDGVNCMLAQPTVNSLMDAFEKLAEEKMYEKIIRGAQASISQLKWDAELRRIEIFLRSL